MSALTDSVQADRPTKVLYLAPWVDIGGSDKGTIDLFRWLDRERYEVSLITTQPSPNRRFNEVVPFAKEAWALPDLLAGPHMPKFIFDFIATREIDVVHVMNSRLGFELLPDLASLPRPPRTVVQLHVEEQDRSGYVRLVTSRFGNLVHAFSVTSAHLARAVEGYEIPRGRIHVIPTGVDAETEFAPDRVEPVRGLGDGRVHVLYAGRLVEQKDPLLMVDVVRRAARETPELLVHVVGDGLLEADTRRAVADAGIGDAVRFHPPTNELAPWFAACDITLMTSVFEGVPYTAYESMAMGVPLVVPALPGNAELLEAGGGVLVDPRDDASAYAAQLVRLARDPALRAEIGARGRERALGELSVREMARAHEELYDALTPALAPRRPPAVARTPAPSPELPRSRRASPTVSVIVPCFNHGRYLPACLEALEAQSYPHVDVTVVDDGSTDPATVALLDELADTDARVIRLEENGGPSRARNAALDVVEGDLVLPVDADNLLLPDAIAQLVEQLQEAPSQVGFIYPTVQFFGNRRDLFRPPRYNLHELLVGNFADTCSLFDARVFREHGIRFADDIRLGHEDWDLMLQLADRGITGERSRRPVMYYRKTGFTRSDAVEQGQDFAERVAERHPNLYGVDEQRGFWGVWRGPLVDVKARWNPALSVIALRPLEPTSDAARGLLAGMAAQSCSDAEVLVRSEADWSGPDHGPALRRLPAALAASQAGALEDGLAEARGAFVVATTGDGSDLLGEHGFVERVLRAVLMGPGLDGLVFADLGDPARPAFSELTPSETRDLEPHGVLLRRDPDGPVLPPALDLSADAPISSLLAALNAGELSLQWRHVRSPHGPPARGTARRPVRLLPRDAPRRGDHTSYEGPWRHTPAIPSLPWDQVRRWTANEFWAPAHTLLLARHADGRTGRRVVTNFGHSPRGFHLERVLGAVQMFQPPGTAELRLGGPEGFQVIPDADEGAPRQREERDPDTLGFIEEAALPLLDALELGFHTATGQWLLVSGPDDPLLDEVEQRRTLGFVEPYPSRPHFPNERPAHLHGLRPLVRAIDRSRRRHVYGLGVLPEGELTLELGALHLEPQEGSVPFWLGSGARGDADHRTAVRWAAAPLAWRGQWPAKIRARAVARRTLDVGKAALPTRRPDRAPERAPDGFLWPEPGNGRLPVYRALHPVTGDELLTRWRLEAADLGYGEATLLGWAASVSLTGSLEPVARDVPWASRFGRFVRRHPIPDSV